MNLPRVTLNRPAIRKFFAEHTCRSAAQQHVKTVDTLEFYIRQTSENEARGPYNLEQLISLSEIGSVTHDTLFYDANREKWTPIGENADLKKSTFPEDTKPRANREIKDAHNATFGLYAIIAMLVISAAAEILPGVDVIMSLAPSRLIEQPIIILGGLDLLFALFIYLGAVEIYPLIRVRAACGMGIFGLMFFLQAHYRLMLPAIAGSPGLYLTTVLVQPKRAQVFYATGLDRTRVRGLAFPFQLSPTLGSFHVAA